MEIAAPYLQAIQNIDGTTRGEKQMALNIIARRIAHAKSSHGHSVNSETLISSVPRLLRPLVLVEVANILHQYEAIIEALKSEDMNVVSRALKARWFFDGSDTSLVNVQYLIETLFPEISLFVRSKMVTKFGNYLKNSSFAMNFFNTLAQQYGVSQALPLLSACDEDFTFETIIEKKLVLPLKIVKRLYRKYPYLVIKYLLNGPEYGDTRNRYRINIHRYINFVPEIAINHFDDFMKICMTYYNSGIKAAKKATNIFIKSHLDLLLKNPAYYLEFLSLKAVTRKLSVDEFIEMFENLFSLHKDSFDFRQLNGYLEYYKPEEHRIPLILDTFRQLYDEDLLECTYLINSDLIKVLPAADRVNQARLKLEDDKDWHIYDSDRSWRCYLPCSESILAIIEEIATTSDAWTRRLLLDQLIYTSRINHDKDNFFKALNYIHDSSRTDNKWTLYYGLSVICDSFELGTFTSTDWEIFKKCFKVIEMEDDIHDISPTTLLLIIETALHYNVLNGLPLDDYMMKFVHLNIRLDDHNWNILTKYPDLEKKFLELFIEFLPNQYFVDNEISCCKINDVIYNLALAIRKFNSRQRVLDDKLDNLSLKNYPWLFGKIKAHILGRNYENDHDRKRFVELIRADEQDLYNVWIRDNHEFWTFGVDVILDVLRRQPQRVLDNWKQCMEEVQSTVHSTQKSLLFIRKIQWYQELPIKFFNESLKIHNQPEKCTAAMVTLALLTDGETYMKIINPYIPNDEKFDIDNPKAKDIHRTLLAIAAELQKVNPPVSLDVIARFCVGDYLRMAMRSLMSVSRQVPIAKVIPFVKMLTERRVSVMKHGIRLMYLVAPLEKIHTFLIDLWNTHSHTSIREVVFTKVYDLFLKKPDSESWLMIQMCLNSLSTNDDETIFDRLTNLSIVPNEYIHEYIRTVLNVLESMEQTGEDPKKYIGISCKLINNIDDPITRILPAEYCQDLVKKYMFVFDYNSVIFQAGLNLTINSYLLASGDYNESRFNFFGEFFRDSVKKYWGKSHPKSSKFYPMNFMAYQFFNNFVLRYQWHNVRFPESLLNIFQSALQPHRDAISYMKLAFAIEYQKSVSIVDFATTIVKKMPELIEFFSPDCTSLISRRLSRFLESRFCGSETRDEIFMDTIEVFVNSGSIYCALIAADMLHSNKYKRLTERHKTVVDILSNSDHLGVASILNERLATFDFCIPEDD